MTAWFAMIELHSNMYHIQGMFQWQRAQGFGEHLQPKWKNVKELRYSCADQFEIWRFGLTCT